jgi:hypothetical protein
MIRYRPNCPESPVPPRLRGPLFDRLRHDGFQSVGGERLGGVVRTVKRVLGPSQLPHDIFGCDKGSKLLRDRRVPCEKFCLIDRLTGIDPLQVVAERGFNSRVFGLGEVGSIVHKVSPVAESNTTQFALSDPRHDVKHGLPLDECEFLETPRF